MKISKDRLVKIIREEIQEAKLRYKIRGVIREFVSGASGMGGAQHTGFQSKERQAQQKTYDDAVSDYDTKDADYQTKRTTAAEKKTALDNFAGRKFKSTNKGGAVTYSSTNTGPRPLGYGPWTLNPEWTTKNDENNEADDAKAAALTAVNTAKTTKDAELAKLDTAKEKDLKREVPTEKPPAAGGGGYASGKTTGKKGKGKKKK